MMADCGTLLLFCTLSVIKTKKLARNVVEIHGAYKMPPINPKSYRLWDFVIAKYENVIPL